MNEITTTTNTTIDDETKPTTDTDDEITTTNANSDEIPTKITCLSNVGPVHQRSSNFYDLLGKWKRTESTNSLLKKSDTSGDGSISTKARSKIANLQDDVTDLKAQLTWKDREIQELEEKNQQLAQKLNNTAATTKVDNTPVDDTKPVAVNALIEQLQHVRDETNDQNNVQAVDHAIQLLHLLDTEPALLSATKKQESNRSGSMSSFQFKEAMNLLSSGVRSISSSSSSSSDDDDQVPSMDVTDSSIDDSITHDDDESLKNQTDDDVRDEKSSKNQTDDDESSKNQTDDDDSSKNQTDDDDSTPIPTKHSSKEKRSPRPKRHKKSGIRRGRRGQTPRNNTDQRSSPSPPSTPTDLSLDDSSSSMTSDMSSSSTDHHSALKSSGDWKQTHEGDNVIVDNQLVFSLSKKTRKRTLIGGDIFALLRHLLQQCKSGSDPEMKAFLLTFREFANPEKIFDFLVEYFENSIGQSSCALSQSLPANLLPTRARTLHGAQQFLHKGSPPERRSHLTSMHKQQRENALSSSSSGAFFTKGLQPSLPTRRVVRERRNSLFGDESVPNTSSTSMTNKSLNAAANAFLSPRQLPTAADNHSNKKKKKKSVSVEDDDHPTVGSTKSMSMIEKSMATAQGLGLDDDESVLFYSGGSVKKKKLLVEHHRVFEFLNLWVSEYCFDYVEHALLIRKSRSFIQSVEMQFVEPDNITATLKASLKAPFISMNSRNTLLKQQAQTAVGAKIRSPVPLRSPKWLQASTISLLSVPPKEMARQLTLIEWQLFSAINPLECVKSNRKKCKSVDVIIQRFNTVSSWVATEVVRQTTNAKQRAATLKYFICVAKQCKKLNNFNTLLEITAGLNLAAVRRLKKTWLSLSSKFALQLDELEGLMDHRRNYKNYRDVLNHCTRPVLPYFGIFLRDITFIGVGNPPYLDAKLSKVNFERLTMIANVLQEIEYYKQVPFDFQPIKPLQNLLTNLLVFPEETLSKHSEKCEPANDSPSTSR